MAAIQERVLAAFNAKVASHPNLAAFEHDVSVLMQDVGKLKSRRLASNAFKLWSKYESKVPGTVLSQRVVQCGDILLKAQEYRLARDLCYGWVLMKWRALHGGGCQREEALASLLSIHEEDTQMTVLLAGVGHSLAGYHLFAKDPAHEVLPHVFHRDEGASALLSLELLSVVMQVALHREALHWVLHNGIALVYALSTLLMDRGQFSEVVQYLLWGIVAMETSVPLMTGVHLPLRTCLYCAVCKCYYALRRPDLAEVLARRALGKVSELIQLQSVSSTPQSKETEHAYKEAAIKLGLMVFRRSVFESRKKTRSILRTKAKPPLRDTLQTPWPRSATEKFITDMFQGKSARFQAILMALENPACLPLEQAAPQPVRSELDMETFLEVHQELVTAGVDLALKSMPICSSDGGGGGSGGGGGGGSADDGKDSEASIGPQLSLEGSLMDLSMEGQDVIPVGSVVCFARMLFSFGYNEAFSLVVDQLIGIIKDCDAVALRCHLAVLRVIQSVVSLRQLKQDLTLTSTGDSSTVLLDALLGLARLLITASELPILESEADLLSTATLVLWEHSRKGYFAAITSHRRKGCEMVLNSPLRKKLLTLLSQTHTLFTALSLWDSHVTAAGEVCLKLAYLLEYSAEDSKPFLEGTDLSGVDPGLVKALQFDRSTLLEAFSVADSGLKGVQQARTALHGRLQHTSAPMGGPTAAAAAEGVELLHVELLCCWVRLRVKLASTLPPPAHTAKQPKLSSLKSKVEEHKALLEKREKLLSLITAANAEIRSWDELITSCGKNHFLSAMYLMQQALLLKELGSDSDEQTSLLSQALTHLKAYTKPSLERASNEVGALEEVCPPPPTLVWLSDDRMVFTPPDHFVPTSGEKVSWYALFGRSASGSNVKVRLNDTHLTGLGVPVPAGRDCKLTVEGLKTNEMYVFAVAAYTQDGHLVGDTIGATSQPILSAFPMPHLAGLAYLCKCSYEAGVLAVAESAGRVLWNHFTEEEEGAEGEKQGLKSINYRVKLRQEVLSRTSPQLVSLFTTCAFILVQVEVMKEGLAYTQLDWTRPPYEQQLQRLAVCKQLLLAVELSSGLEGAELCLQAVVMCYGVLAPLIQHQLMAPPLAKIVLKCLCVLKELPKSVLLQHPAEQKQHIHHMIAVLASQGLKVLHVCNSRGLLAQLGGAAKDLLTATLVTTDPKPLPLGETSVSKAWSKSAQVGGQNLSESIRLLQTTGRVKTAELKGGKEKKMSMKRKSKKMAATANALAEEHKSDEVKALEACLTAWRVDSQEVELTGQEDITLLYGTLATESAVNAHKDVHKFRRRPRYLEFFVLLCCKALEEGHYSSVVAWSEEALSWLRRRNELLVQPKVPMLTRREPATLTGDQARYANAVTKYIEKPKSHVLRHHSQLAVKTPQDSLRHSHSPHVPAQPRDTQALVPTGDTAKYIKRDSSKSVLPAGLGAMVTRDDLIGKAKSVLQSLLSEYYHQIARRRRLRAVTAEELPWRAELHLLLAQSYLEQLSLRLRPMRTTSEREAPDKLHSFPASLLLLDNAGVLMEGVLGMGAAVATEKGDMSTTEQCYSSSPRPKQTDDNDVERDGEVYSPHTPQDLVEEVETGGSGTRGEETSASMRSPRGRQAGTEKAKTYVLPPELEGMAEIATEFQKAVVLSHRGSLWTLLQNTCHEMYTSVSHTAQLLSAIPSQVAEAAGDSPSDRGRGLQAVLYRCMARALYSGSVALMDMVLQLEARGMVNLRKELPDVLASEKDDKRFLSPHSIDLGFLVRFVLLSLHTLHSSQLWERLVDLISTFNQLTNYKYAEVTVPLLKQSQEELLLRLSAHRYTHKGQGIHAAAHLDPGPSGHDIYGRRGHALGLTTVGIDPKEAEGELDRRRAAPVNSCDLLSRSRTLLARSLMRLGEGDVCEGTQQGGSLRSEGVVEAYQSAVEELKRDKETLLAAAALLELGTVQFHRQDSRSASDCWTEGLSILLKSSDVLNHWRTVLKSPHTALKDLGYQRLWTAFVLSARLAKYIYVHELDVRLEYTLLAVALTKCLQSGSVEGAVNPGRDLDYLHLQYACPALPRDGALSGTSPSSVLDALAFVSEALLDYGHCDKALPVLCVYHTFASSVCRSVEHVARCKVLRVEAMTQLYLYSEAILALRELLSGSGLPQEHNHFSRPPQSHRGRSAFSNALPLSDPQNFKVLAHLLDKQLPPSLASLYGPAVVYQLSLAKARLYTALARSIPEAPSVSVVSRQGAAEPSRPTTALSTLSSYLPATADSEGATSPTGSATSSGSKTHPGHGSHPTATAAAKELRTPPAAEIKSSLLQHAEDNILFVYRQQEEETAESQHGCRSSSLVIIKCYLAMVQVCLVQLMPSLAANCALAAMRVVQTHFEQGVGDTPTGEVVGTQAWLACREALAESLAHLHSHAPHLSSPLSLASVCAEGQREASACGMSGTVALLQWCRAVHCLGRKKADLDSAVSSLEECLKALESCQSLSPALRLVKTRASFHLAVLVTLSSGAHAPEEGIVGVVTALARDLSKEITAMEVLSPSRQGQPGNAYLPHRVLLAQCQLFLGHYGCSSLHLSRGLKECRSTTQRSALLEVQLLYNLGAASKAHSLDDAKLADAACHLQPFLWLTEAVSLCSQSNSLHRLCELCFVENADVFIERCEAVPLASSAATPERRQRGSQLSKGGTSSQLDQQSTPVHSDRSSSSASTAADSRLGLRKQQKDRYVDTVIAWCSLLAACLTHQACQRLDATALEMGRQDLNKALSDKAISALPDAFLLELVRGGHSYPATSSVTPLSLHALSPSSQTVKAASITWRQVFALLNEMRQRMSPSNLSPILTHYSPPLAYDIEAECRSLHKTLLEHCASVYEVCLTPLLPRLVTEHLTKMCIKHRVDLPVTPLPTTSQAQVERWFGAGESRIIQHFYAPAMCRSGTEKEEEGTAVLVAFNAKPIKHLSSFTMASTSGINVVKVSGTRRRLSRVKESLEDCAHKLEEAVMTSGAAEKGSKARRSSMAARTVIPPDVQPVLSKALEEVYALCSREQSKGPPPHLSMQALSDLADLLDPSSAPASKMSGELCCLLTAIAREKQI